jgi:hypothetical protein
MQEDEGGNRRKHFAKEETGGNRRKLAFFLK